MYMRFRKLDRGRKGAVTVDDLSMIPELSTNPLGPRLVELLDEEHSGQILFHQFLQRMSVFSGRSGREAKAAFMFRMWDADGDGYISAGDMVATLKSMVGRMLPETTLAELAKRTMEAADLDGDGKLTRHEFDLSMANSALGHTLTVPMVGGDDDGPAVNPRPPATSPTGPVGFSPKKAAAATGGGGSAAPTLDLPSLPPGAAGSVPKVIG